MQALPGFELLETVGGDRWSIVRRARQGQRSVLLRLPGKEYPSVDELARLKYGFDVSQQIDSPAVLKVFALERHAQTLVLVMEDFGGVSLRSLMASGPIPLVDAIPIAGQLAKALGELHRHQIVHKNIEPSNVFVNQGTGEVKIGHFDLASRLSWESPTLTAFDRLEGTLAYISPEQTGRMNRGIDYRTDLYSLGVTLYELLVGRVPFDSADPMTVVHSHIAVQPIEPREARAAIPLAVSDVVMKLLAKNAEDRYQSAYGLAVDLRECENQLKASGTIAGFVPGTHDASATFQIPQKLYGREEEKRQLLAAFERVAAGSTETMLVSGYSGVGKSSLVNEIHKPIVERRGYFGAGKFDQLQNAPYGALIQAFQDLIRQLLAESEEKVAAWRHRLVEALGTEGQVLVDVIPAVALIVGPQPPVPPMGPSESQNRFNLIFRQFIGVFARPEHPLAIFLDDLQWADSASLSLLTQILGDTEIRHLFLIGAYRDNEVHGAHRLLLALADMKKGPAALREISLRPLHLADVTQLLSDTLAAPADPALVDLAVLVHQKTQGNPFFANQFLTSLAGRKLLAFDPDLGRWSWSLERIREEAITDNVATLMAEKIRSLQPDAQRVVRLGACIGASFDLRLLSAIAAGPAQRTAAELWEAVQAGLILPVGAAYKYVPTDGAGELTDDQLGTRYRFVHDRVQEAAYALSDEETRRDVHLKIGRLMLAWTPTEERPARIFDIVNQLDLAIDRVTDPGERIEVARLNLAAGVRAKSSTAYAAAGKYLEVGTSLLAEESWQNDYDLSFALYRHRSECDYLLGRFEAAEAGFDRVLKQARSKGEQRDIYSLKMSLSQSRFQFPEALRAGYDGLRVYGIEVPPDDGLKAAFGQEFATLQAHMAGRTIASLADLPDAQDPDHKGRGRMLSELIHFGAYVNPDLFAYLSAKLINISIEQGNTPGSATGYFGHAMILGAAFGDYASSDQFGRVALAVSERLDDLSARAAVHFFYGMFIDPWRNPIRTLFSFIEKSYVEALESGNLSFVGLSGMQMILMGFIAGDELHGLHDRSVKQFDFQRRLNQPIYAAFIASSQRAMVLLTQGAIPADRLESLDDGVLRQQLAAVKAWITMHHVFCLQTAFLFEDYKEALERSALAADGIASIFGFLGEPELRFYQTLLFTAVHGQATPEEREARAKVCEEHLTKMRLWATNEQGSFLHKQLLMQAELARIAGREQEAMNLYDQAIEAAAQTEFLQHRALTNELAGRFHLGHGRKRIARAYLTEARYAYARWGADAKVADLDRRYEEILPRQEDAGKGGSGTTAASLDLSTVMKASQAISGEIVLSELVRRLLSTIVENAGAQRGLLILKGDSPLTVELDRTVGDGAPALHAASYEARTDVATAVIRYVERTLETVVLADASLDGKFQSDAYVARSKPKSLLCMPVLKQKVLVGILYLENNLVAGAFTPERCNVLDLLSAQAAISLENARLYDTLDNRVKERTRELRETNEELSRTLQQLKKTQKQLIMQEKLASLGALTSGIAHEIKNPLNFVNNFAEASMELTDELREVIEEQRSRLDPTSLKTVEELLADLRENAREINAHGKRADNIVTAMLEHSRSGAGERREADLNALLKEYQSLAYQGLRSQSNSFNVAFEEDYDPSLAPVNVVPQDIGRVFLNLINNACYAVAAKKKQQGERFSPTIRLSTRALGDSIEIRVRDNGGGMPEKVRERIFDPFFTTKPPGEGTGLGLSISHDIITEGNGGTIAVESVEGEFAEFVVTLPRSRA
ncbi:MAG: GAF domain-containing protein [Myxococcales bacterium]|nr:GAF domain-containing protein [Myxococcales bacterium]